MSSTGLFADFTGGPTAGGLLAWNQWGRHGRRPRCGFPGTVRSAPAAPIRPATPRTPHRAKSCGSSRRKLLGAPRVHRQGLGEHRLGVAWLFTTLIHQLLEPQTPDPAVISDLSFGTRLE